MRKIQLFILAILTFSMFGNPFSLRDKTQKLLDSPDVLWFQTGVYFALDSIPEPIAPELAFEGFEREFGYYIVKFDGDTREEWKDKILNSQNSDIFYYVPTHSWIFRLENPDVLIELPFVKAIIPLVPSFRVRPQLLSEQQEGDSLTGMVRLKVTVFKGDNFTNLADVLVKMGATLIDASQGYHHEFIVIDIPPDRTREFALFIARNEATEWVERDYPDIPLNDWSRWIVQSYNTSGMISSGRFSTLMSVDYDHVPIHRRNLYGQDQYVGYLDSGLDYLSVYFCDNAINTPPQTTGWVAPADNGHRKIRAYNRGTSTSGDFDDTDVSLGGHGTHVGGSIAGDNEAHDPVSGTYDQGDGMAPKARLVFTDGANGSYGIYTPTDMNTLFDYAQDCGAYIHSNSYGSSSPNYYSTDAQQCDEFMWNNHNFLIFFAAGNDNNDSPAHRIATYNCAKNLVSVGASESGFGYGSSSYTNPGSSSGNDPENMAEFSSHGPTDEGLLKPNVTVPGGWYIWSADNVDGGSMCHTGMEYMGGTSMACPTCAGMTALVRQYFTEGFYPSGGANAGDAFAPSGALMKAMLINGTRNMSGSYTIDATNNSGHQDAPSNGQGWGRVVMDDCMYFDDGYGTDVRRLFIDDHTSGFTSSGQSQTYYLNTGPSTTEPIKIVLSYSDYPGSPAVGTPGVNDLNLEVSIDGDTYLGNNFASSGARSVTGGSTDPINRDEVVWLDAIPSQSLVITVDATTINTSAQPYALVVTGDVTEGSPNSRPEVPDLSPVLLFDNARTPLLRPALQFFVPVDDDGDPLHFEVQIDDVDDFVTPIATYSSETDGGFSGVSFPATEGTAAAVTYTFTSDLTNGNTYFWRVRADDGVMTSYWSDSRSLTVDSGISDVDWFQTVDPQFERGIPSDVDIASDKVNVGAASVAFEDDFESYASQTAFEAEWTVSDPYSYLTLQTSSYHSSNHAIRINDTKTFRAAYYHHTFTSLTSGYAECWSGAASTSDEALLIALYQGSTEVTQIYYRESYVALWDGSYRYNMEAIDAGNWHYFRLDFDCVADEIYVTIDSNVYGPYSFMTATSHVDAIYQGPMTNAYTCNTYYDDIKIGQGVGTGSGTLLSPDIVLSNAPEAISWDRAYWTQDAGDSIVLVVEKKISGSYVPFDSANTSGTTGEIDLAGLGSPDTIRLRAKLAVSGGIEPDLYDWTVSFQRNIIGLNIYEGSEGGPDYTEWNMGMMPAYSHLVMTESQRAYVKNTGGVAIDLSMNATGSSWAFSNWPGIDTCLIMALFFGTSAPVAADYDTSEDYLTGTFKDAGGTDIDPFASPVYNGVNILPAEGRMLYMLLATPEVNNEPDEQRITITIQAAPH